MTTYYVVYETATGAVVTRYISGIHDALIASPPAGLSLYKAADEAEAMQTVPAGWSVVNGVLAAPTPPAPPTLAELQAAAKTAIDVQAGAQRALFVSPGDLIDQEYRHAYDDASSFKTAGYPSTSVPASVSDWAAQNPGWTDQQAADNIISTHTQWMGVIEQIRAARLNGKTAVSNATDAASVNSALSTAITNLKAIHP